jgi:hypothetical protein
MRVDQVNAPLGQPFPQRIRVTSLVIHQPFGRCRGRPRPRRGVSVNSFLDTRGPKIRLHQSTPLVAHVFPGQELCSHAVQSTTSHYIDAGTRAAPDGGLPWYQRSSAIRDSPSVSG